MLPARRKKGGQMLRFRDRGGAENRRNSRTDYPCRRRENTHSQRLRYAERMVFAGVIAAESGSMSSSVCRKTCTSIGWGRFLFVKKKAEEKNSAILKVPFSPPNRSLILAVACPKEKKGRFGMLAFCNAPFSLSGCGVFVFSNEAAEIFSFCRQKK